MDRPTTCGDDKQTPHTQDQRPVFGATGRPLGPLVVTLGRRGRRHERTSSDAPSDTNPVRMIQMISRLFDRRRSAVLDDVSLVEGRRDGK